MINNRFFKIINSQYFSFYNKKMCTQAYSILVLNTSSYNHIFIKIGLNYFYFNDYNHKKTVKLIIF